MSAQLGLGAFGISIDISADDGHLDDAAQLEGQGYSTLWIPGGQLDRLDRVREVIRATESVQVATGIVMPDVYDATDVHGLYVDLERTDPRRFVVGLGGPHGAHSLPGLHRYLDALDAADPPVPRERRVLAALGPRKLEIARERCAGAVTLLVTPEFTTATRQVLGAAAVLVVEQMVVLDRHAERARETARGHVRFLSSVAGYRASFARMGFSGEEIDGLADRLVDALVAWGDADAIAQRVTGQLAAGADQVVVVPVHDEGQPGPVEVGRELSGLLHGHSVQGRRAG